MLSEKEMMFKLTKISNVDSSKIIEMTEKIRYMIDKELAKEYGKEHVSEYRFMSRIYNQLANSIDSAFRNE